MSAGWTTPEDIAARVRRRWNDSSLLRAYAEGEPFEPIEMVLRGPRPSEVGDDIAAARDWVARLEAGHRGERRYSLEWRSIGGRQVGRNEIPSRAVVSTFDQAWALLGTVADVRSLDAILETTSGHPLVRSWVERRPFAALDVGDDIPRLVAAVEWLHAHRDSGRYLREISAPGVDTKFAERHRGILADILGVPTSASGFLTGLGLQTRPELVRLRVGPSAGLPEQLTDLTLRADELAALPLTPASAMIVENEVTFLSVSVPADGIVLWGKGFEVDRVGRLPWLGDVDIAYWGDLDTHGFAILDRLRAHLSQTRSLLMDADTLLAHRDRWVREERPATSVLTRLTSDEAEVYTALVSDVWGEQVRLEQERIDWSWVERYLPRDPPAPRSSG